MKTTQSRPLPGARFSAGLMCAILAGFFCVSGAHAADSARIVSVSGTLTEIVFALGGGGHIVGVDTTSTYPADTGALPKVGYQRTLSAEGVLSLSPTLLLATEDAGPPEAMTQLRQAGVSILMLSGAPTIEALEKNIAAIAGALGRPDAGVKLAQRVLGDYQLLRRNLDKVQDAPRVMFLLNTGQGQLLVSGTGTKADAMIRLAGARNAVQEYEGYKPLSAEAAAAAAPDVLLLTTEGMRSGGGMDGVRAMPGLALTPALRENRVVHLDALYMLGYGPRFPAALRELALALHPGLALPVLSTAGR